jgi:hypothetical protein
MVLDSVVDFTDLVTFTADDFGVVRRIIMFTVKDSGKREEYTSGMRRDTNEGKTRYDLLIPETMKVPMLKRWADHMTKGAQKYGDRNWEKAAGLPELSRFRESAFRHFMQWYHGENDEDHAAAIMFNVQGAEYVLEKIEPQMTENKFGLCDHIPHPEFDYLCAICGQVVKTEKWRKNE